MKSSVQIGEGDDLLRIEALELANHPGLDIEDVLRRAAAFHRFLTAGSAPQPAFPCPEGASQFVGTKVIYARPMTRAEYNFFRGWALPRDENGDDAGYLVEYADGVRPNVDGHQGYVSWSPADVFDAAYSPVIS